MSVINQMLKDLETRRSVSEHGRYISPVRKGEVSWLVWLPVSLLLGIGIGLIFWHQIRGGAVTTSVPAVITPAHSSDTRMTSPSTAAATLVIQDKMSSQVSPAAPIENPVSASRAANNISPAPSQALALSSVAKVSDGDTEADDNQVTQDEELTGVAGEQNVKVAPDDALTVEGGGEDTAIPAEESSFAESAPQDQLQIDEVTLSPDEEAALQRKQAEQAINRGDLVKAKEAFYALLQAKPTDTQAREKLAALLFGAGDEAGARHILEQGMALAPDYANFRLLSARIDMSNGQKSRALATLRGCEPDVSRDMDFYATRAALAQELGDYPLAAASYQKLTFRQPAEGRWWMGLAISYEKGSRPQAALDAYRHAQAASGLSATSREFVRQRLARLEHTP